jgi:hypothetical protein
LLSEGDQLRVDPAVLDLELDHRVLRSAPALGRAARVQDQDAFVPRDLGDVRVPVDDGGAGREPRRQPSLPARAWAAVVHEPDPHAAGLDHVLGG